MLPDGPGSNGEEESGAHSRPSARFSPVFHDLDALWRRVESDYLGDPLSVHGPEHWKRVERNGLAIAESSGADLVIVCLFAVLHDSRRTHDEWDLDHGEAAGRYAATLRSSLLDVSDARFETLVHACHWHAHGQLSEDPTIATCWDADRLDLPRVGIAPDPLYFSTEEGKARALAWGRRE